MIRQLQRGFEPSAQEAAARKLFSLASRDAVIRGALATPRHVSNLLMMAQSVGRGCQACSSPFADAAIAWLMCWMPAAVVAVCALQHAAMLPGLQTMQMLIGSR